MLTSRADFDLMYGIAEFLWGAVLGERSAAWYSKQATNNDAMRPKETQRPIIFNSMGLPPNAAPASRRLAGIRIWGQRYRTLSRNPL